MIVAEAPIRAVATPVSAAPGPIILREWVPMEVQLDDGDATYISRQLGKRITLERLLAGPGYVLNGNQFTGVVTLPSGRRLECRPKVPIGTLFTMLAVAYDLDVPVEDDFAKLGSFDNLLGFMVQHFIRLVDERLTAGMFRDYVEQEDNLLAVRGRIVIGEDVRRNTILRHRTWCRYAEFTHDVPDNQIIRQVVHLLTGWPLPPALLTRLRSLDAMMGNITPTRFGADIFARFRYDRLRDGYQPIHRYCHLFLDGLSLEALSGAIDFRAFLIDMNALFEAFVARAVAARLPRGTTLRTQAPTPLDRVGSLSMSIDLLLQRAGRAVLVADTKYKAPAKGQSPADVYQMLAYCTATAVPTAVLIYPLDVTGRVPPPIAVRNTPVTILSHTVDLSLMGEELIRELDRVTSDLVALTTPTG